MARIAAVAGRLVLVEGAGAGRVMCRRGHLGGFRAANLARAVFRRREAESLGHVRAGVDRAAGQLAPVQQVQRLQAAHERQCDGSQTESRRRSSSADLQRLEYARVGDDAEATEAARTGERHHRVLHDAGRREERAQLTHRHVRRQLKRKRKRSSIGARRV